MASYKHKLINTEFGTLVLPRLEDISNVPGDTPCVGVVMSVGATTEYSLVKIDLDPSW